MHNFANAQKLAKTVQGNLDAFQNFADIMFGASEQLIALNLDAARKACTWLSASASPLTTGDLREQFAARADAQGKSLEQAADYIRNFNELFIRTQGDIAAFGTQQIEQASHVAGEIIEQLARSAPGETGDFLTAMKAAMSNATTAYENFVRTSRDVAESNLAAASNALQPVLTASAGNTRTSRKAA